MQPEEGLYDYRQQGHHSKYWVNMQNGKEYVYNVSTDPSEKKILSKPFRQHKKNLVHATI